MIQYLQVTIAEVDKAPIAKYSDTEWNQTEGQQLLSYTSSIKAEWSAHGDSLWNTSAEERKWEFIVAQGYSGKSASCAVLKAAVYINASFRSFHVVH